MLSYLRNLDKKNLKVDFVLKAIKWFIVDYIFV